MKKTFSNLINILLILLVLGIIFVPSVKSGILSGLMKIGLFSPEIENKVISKTPENLQLTFTNDKGESMEFSELKGKVVFLNFWATWCPPCRAEMPSIQELKKRIGKENIVFIFVDADGNLDKSNAWLKEQQYDFDNFKTNFNNVPKDWYKGSLPTTIVLNKDGDKVYQHTGTANYDTDAFFNFLNTLTK